MPFNKPHRFAQRISQFRHSLADINALPQLTAIGILIGLFASLLIIAFRLLIAIPLDFFLPEHNENFEGLPTLAHLLLPLGGAIIIASCFHFIPKKFHDVSVGNVLERLHNFQGRMATGNLLVQFFGGIISLISGQSVGREGPAVHIGASAASILGQWLKLPNNSLRILIGCGVAAAISASFNTPIAGVIFAMEVVLMSYSIVGFIPIMMASVCGAIVTRLVFGEEAFFTVTSINMHGLWELALMVGGGFVVGIFATIYMRLQLGFNRFHHYPVSARIIAAGLFTGIIALWVPEILGLGYDTINLALEQQLGLAALVMILVAKMVATSFSISMGIPGGLIGPQLFIGACLGAIFGDAVNIIFAEEVSNTGFYVLLGMAAMMGAVINAPLAALMAVLELTYNPSIIFPSMLMIVIACITTRQLFSCEGIFMEQLAINGKSLASGPTQQMLSSIGVRSAMNSAFIECDTIIERQTAKHLLQNNPLWLVIHQKEELTLLRAADLALHIGNSDDQPQQETINLLDIPAQRLALFPIDERSTLYEAQQYLHEQKAAEALYVTSQSSSEKIPHHQSSDHVTIFGIITQETINNQYRL